MTLRDVCQELEKIERLLNEFEFCPVCDTDVIIDQSENRQLVAELRVSIERYLLTTERAL